MKKFAILVGMVACLFFFSPAQAAYPDREISLVTAHAAGTSTDAIIRFLSDVAGKIMGQQIVVINKPGASYIVGNAQVINSKPDGYTFGFCHAGAFAYVPHIIKVPYDYRKDVTWIMTCADYTNGVVVKPDSPWKTLDELLDYAKKNPGKFIWSHDGYGLPGHIIMEYLAVKKGGIDWKFVPIAGGPKQATSLLGGHTHAWAAGGFHVQFVKDKTMRLLASFDRTRLKAAPDVPTLLEMGYDLGVKGASYTLFGPKGIPEPIVRKLEDTFYQATKDPDFIKVLDNYEIVPSFRNSKQVAEYMDAESKAMERLIKVTGIKTEKEGK